MSKNFDLEEVKKDLTKIWGVFKPSWIGRINLQRQPYHVKNLNDIVLKLDSLGTGISKKKHFIELKILLDQYNESNGFVKNFNKWEFSVYKRLGQVIEELNIFEELNKEKNFGTYKISECLPKTFEYLKIYLPMRRPEYIGKKTPDVNIKFRRSKLNKFMITYVKKKSWPQGGDYWPANNAININLTTLLPISLLPKTEDDFKKILKYIDSNRNYSQILVHEYEHFIQFKILPKPLKTYYYQTKIRKGVGFNYPITAVIFMKTFGLPIYILFKKLFKKQGFIVTLAEYKYTRMELEGRLAQFIFLIAYGHPESDIRGTERIHDVFLGKVERDKDVYIAGLEKQQQNLAQLKASRRPKEEIAQVKKNIESLKKRILEMGQFEKDYSYLLEEARRIGFEIKKKREEILNQSGS